MNHIGQGYLTSGAIKVSSANEELIPKTPEDWTVGYKVRKFSYINAEDVTVLMTDYKGNVTEMILPSMVGFEIDYNDPPITSFVMKEADVPYYFSAIY